MDEFDADTDDSFQTPEEKIMSEARERYSLAQEAESQNRVDMLDDVRFARLADQWPESAKADRNRPGQERPMLVVNRLLQFRERVVNEIRQNTPSIRVRPVNNEADESTADVLMGIIRHIQDNSNASIAYDTAVEWQVDCGLGYIRVRNDWASDTSFDQEIYIDRIPDIFKVYYDPHSTHPDGSDAEWCLIAEEITKEEFERKYPGVDMTQWASIANGDSQGWYGKDMVRIAEYYYIEREQTIIQDPETGRQRMTEIKRCMWAKLAGNSVLEQTELPTKYIPVIPVLGQEVWLQGRRHLAGLVRNAKDPQRLYNYYLSANAEQVALSPKAPFIGAAGQFESDPNWASANRNTHAYLEYDPVTIAGTAAGAPQRAQPPQASSAILQAIQLAENDIMQSMGIYQPSLGGESNETSGRALLLRQKQAETGNFHFQDNLNRSIRQVGRVIVDMIPKVYDQARVVRILGEDGTAKTAQLDPSIPAPSMYTDNPAIESIYNPTIGQYDVVCDAGPSYATKRDEAANMMLTLTQANPSLFGIIGDIMIQNMDWPGAEEISRRLQAMLPPQLQRISTGENVDPQILQAQQAMEQMATQMEHMGQEIQNLRDQRMLEIQKVEREWFDSATKRMDVQGKIMMTDAQLQQAISENFAIMMGQGTQQLVEEDQEMEGLEDKLVNGPPPAPPSPPPPSVNPAGGPPMQPPAQAGRRGPGSMTRKADTPALTGQAKPGEMSNTGEPQ
jgi:hypothetical protein